MSSRDYHSGYYRREPPPIPPHSHQPPHHGHQPQSYHGPPAHHGRINQHPAYQEKQGRPSFSPTPDSGYRNFFSNEFQCGSLRRLILSRRPECQIFLRNLKSGYDDNFVRNQYQSERVSNRNPQRNDISYASGIG